MTTVYGLIFIAAGYISGSVLWSKMIAKIFFGEDIVAKNSDKNPGAANVFHTCGIPAGIGALICDVLKGFLPVYISMFFVPADNILFSFIAAAPVLGHIFPIFFRFRGGKAIAVSFGVLAALSYINPLPFVFLVILYIFFSLVIVFRPHVWRSVVVYVLFGFLSAFFVNDLFVMLSCVIIAVAVFLRHFISRDRNEPVTMSLFLRKEK